MQVTFSSKQLKGLNSGEEADEATCTFQEKKEERVEEKNVIKIPKPKEVIGKGWGPLR